VKRFIVDTNVLIAGLLTQRNSSPTVRWLRILLYGEQPVLVSPELLSEYRMVLQRKISGITGSDIDELLASILSHAHVVDPPAARERPPDAGDAHIGALLAADSDARLVTGDKALVEARADSRTLDPPNAAAQWLVS
jgi:putative PIN family toxin of toxin-antitoxin system